MRWDKFSHHFGESGWGPKLRPFIESEECDNIYKFLKAEKARGKIMCPEHPNTFRAFKETPYNELKCIWFLQNPFPWFKGDKMVADGIALSCSNTKRLQPSLEQFYWGIEDDLHNGLNLNYEPNPDLSYLCRQGIMMLNTSLTVEMNKPGSQVELWLPFMRYLLEEVIANYNPGLVIVLSGKCSMFLEKYINPLQHHLLFTEHPAAASHEFRSWRHEKVFTKINTLLRDYYDFEPDWLDNQVPF